ncbi:MAG: acyl-CoA carboxylase subunit beta [Acidimicrobiales bacterium]
MTATVHEPEPGQALGAEAATALADAAERALTLRLPLVLTMASSGPSPEEDVSALDGWGRVARAVARCSGMVPVVAVVGGPLLSGPALLLGLVDAVVMTSAALVYVSGPAAVAQVTGVPVQPEQLGGYRVHSARSGVATLVAADLAGATELVAQLLSFLPLHCDQLPPFLLSGDPASRPTPELRDAVPTRASGSYVTGFVRLGGYSVGVLANQPQSMSGTLDIAASQKGASFVGLCDAFNVPLLTIVDTSGFMPGRDLEWRGIIRHGAELVFAYAEATVPRVSLIVRKAYGGAYIVMDSKGMGNDICIAWPSAELAVMGAEGAVSIVHRRAAPEDRARLVEDYERTFLNPYVAAERGYVDMVIDPAETRKVLIGCFRALSTKRERLVSRKHGNSPL